MPKKNKNKNKNEKNSFCLIASHFVSKNSFSCFCMHVYTLHTGMAEGWRKKWKKIFTLHEISATLNPDEALIWVPKC